MEKGKLSIDPRGLIYESYRIEGITIEECRSIFLDWALGVPVGEDTNENLAELARHYAADHPDHPMTAILKEGLTQQATRKVRKGRQGRRGVTSS